MTTIKMSKKLRLVIAAFIISITVFTGGSFCIFAINIYFKHHHMDEMVITPGVNTTYLYLYSIITACMAALGAMLWKKLLLREDKKNNIKLDTQLYFWKQSSTSTKTYLGYSLLVATLAIFFIIINPTIFSLPEITSWQSTLLLETLGSNSAFYNFLQSAIILAPIWEEIIYRGILFSGLMLIIPTQYVVIITSALWALSHYSQYTPVILIEIFIIGLILGHARQRTLSIKVPLITHMTNNLIAFTYMYYYSYSL